MLEGVRKQRARRLIVGIGKHQMAHRLRDETEFAARKILARPRQQRIGTTHIVDVFFPRLDRRQRIEMDRIGVIPAEIFLVDRLHIMPDVTIVAARMPGTFQALRQADGLGDLARRQTMIH